MRSANVEFIKRTTKRRHSPQKAHNAEL